MSETTRFVREDEYEEMGSSYQCLQVSMLDSILKDHGVDDPDTRRKICESFLFAMGQFHDFGWLKASADGNRLYPLLCFASRFLDTDTPVDSLGEVFAQSEMFSFHEYAIGNASLLYEGDPHAEVEFGFYEGND